MITSPLPHSTADVICSLGLVPLVAFVFVVVVGGGGCGGLFCFCFVLRWGLSWSGVFFLGGGGGCFLFSSLGLFYVCLVGFVLGCSFLFLFCFVFWFVFFFFFWGGGGALLCFVLLSSSCLRLFFVSFFFFFSFFLSFFLPFLLPLRLLFLPLPLHFSSFSSSSFSFSLVPSVLLHVPATLRVGPAWTAVDAATLERSCCCHTGCLPRLTVYTDTGPACPRTDP